MGDKPIREQVGSSFIQHCYQVLDNERTEPDAIYIDESCLTWEGQKFQGKAAIVEKLSSLLFQKIQHSIVAVNWCKAAEDPVMGFQQMLLLQNINDAWVCTNCTFRLALYNFG